MKETKRVRYYYRYADDIVILDGDKARLHALLVDIKEHLRTLKLEVKENHQVFPVDAPHVRMKADIAYVVDAAMAEAAQVRGRRAVAGICGSACAQSSF